MCRTCKESSDFYAVKSFFNLEGVQCRFGNYTSFCRDSTESVELLWELEEWEGTLVGAWICIIESKFDLVNVVAM